MENTKIKIAFVLANLKLGGVEKVVLSLAKGFVEKGLEVTLVLANEEGDFLKQVPCRVNIDSLNIPAPDSRGFFANAHRVFVALVRYFSNHDFDVVFPSWYHIDLIIMFAIRLVNLFKKNKTRIVLILHIPYEFYLSQSRIKFLFSIIAAKIMLKLPDKLVAVSESVKKSFGNYDKIAVICNPVVTQDLFVKSNEPVDQDFFTAKKVPVIISVGRLSQQKDFTTLLRAFVIVKKEIDSQLVILGEGEERENLQRLARDLHIEDSVWMPGFAENPYKYVSKSSVFVLPSKFEGLPLALIEALAVGCPVVSTDCPGGSKEILENGKYGKLVPVGDHEAIAKAIIDTLKNPPPKELLQERGKMFSVEAAVNKYLELIWDLK